MQMSGGKVLQAEEIQAKILTQERRYMKGIVA